jgi:hypothetical protein
MRYRNGTLEGLGNGRQAIAYILIDAIVRTLKDDR